MTAARPYRMTPLTSEQALAELRKFAGIQFDPVVVDAFVTHDVGGRRAGSGPADDATPNPAPGRVRAPAWPRPCEAPSDFASPTGRHRRDPQASARPTGSKAG